MQKIPYVLILSATALATSAFLTACGGSASAPLQDQSALVAVSGSTSINTSGTTGGDGTGAVHYVVTSGNCSISGNI